MDCREHEKQTPLHLAAGKAHMDALQMLIQHGAFLIVWAKVKK